MTKTAVIGVSEVLPKNCKTKTQMAEICIEGYDCFENLSSAKRGVCIYTHVSLNGAENRDMTQFDEEESVWCDVKLTENDRLLIGCIYRSPKSNISNDAKINKALIHGNNLGFSHVLIMGYLNHPSINWYDSTSPPDVDHPSTLFLEAVRGSSMSQHAAEPTHCSGTCTPNTIDMILTNE